MLSQMFRTATKMSHHHILVSLQLDRLSLLLTIWLSSRAFTTFARRKDQSPPISWHFVVTATTHQQLAHKLATNLIAQSIIRVIVILRRCTVSWHWSVKRWHLDNGHLTDIQEKELNYWLWNIHAFVLSLSPHFKRKIIWDKRIDLWWWWEINCPFYWELERSLGSNIPCYWELES